MAWYVKGDLPRNPFWGSPEPEFLMNLNWEKHSRAEGWKAFLSKCHVRNFVDKFKYELFTYEYSFEQASRGAFITQNVIHANFFFLLLVSKPKLHVPLVEMQIKD